MPAVHPRPGTLHVYIVKDSSKTAPGSSGCTLHPPTTNDERDTLSVRGGCLRTSSDAMEVRCSAEAARLFADTGNELDRESPALLYVLAHEFGHLYQRQSGEYIGRVEVIDLKAERGAKLTQLQSSCDPASTVSLRIESFRSSFSILYMPDPNRGSPPRPGRTEKKPLINRPSGTNVIKLAPAGGSMLIVLLCKNQGSCGSQHQ